MNSLHHKKLLRTKWTAVVTANKEKHFIVVGVLAALDPAQPPEWIDLEALYTNVTRRIAWRELRDPAHWRQGWN